MSQIPLKRASKIEDIELTTRARNCLKDIPVHTIGEWIDLSNETLYDLPKMGLGTFRELLQKKSDLLIGRGSYLLIDQEPTDTIVWNGKCYYDLPFAQIDSFEKLEKRLYDKNLFMLSDIYDFQNDSLRHPLDISTNLKNQLTGLLREEHVTEELVLYKEQPDLTEYEATILASKILHVLPERSLFGLKKEELYQQIADSSTNEKVFTLALEQLQKENSVALEDGYVRRYFPKLLDVVNSHLDDRKVLILNMRFEGMTLEAIATEFGLTKERIRQLEKKAHEVLGMVDEMRYIPILESYDFTEEAFCAVFPENANVYYYLQSEVQVDPSQRKDLEDLLEDENYPIGLRQRVQKYLYRNYVSIDGMKIPADRPALVRYAVQKYCSEQTSFDDFKEIYRTMIDEINRENGTSLDPEVNRTVEVVLSQKANYTLWMPKKRVRYYNLPEYDFAELVEELDLSRYMNKEITTKKLYEEFPELMQHYEIRDYYELHSLLKQIWKESGNCDVEFGRNPTLKIGDCDRDAQLKQLLFQLAPVSLENYCRAYEALYGASAATVQGSYLDCLNLYYHDKMFTIDADVFTVDQFETMSDVLTEDYYSLDDVKDIFLSYFPAASRGKINSYNLKSLGFKVYTDCIVSDRFQSLWDYVRHLLTKEAVFDELEFPKSLRTNNEYFTVLYQLRREREIVEYEKNKYVSASALNDMGLSKERLETYWKELSSSIAEGDFFTAHSLREANIDHRFADCSYSDWFYDSLLAEEKDDISYIHLWHSRLFRKGARKPKYKDFVRWLLKDRGEVSLVDLAETIEHQYGIRIRRDKLIYAIQDANLYYDKITQRVYLNDPNV